MLFLAEVDMYSGRKLNLGIKIRISSFARYENTKKSLFPE